MFRIQTTGIVGCLKEKGKGCLPLLFIQDYIVNYNINSKKEVQLPFLGLKL